MRSSVAIFALLLASSTVVLGLQKDYTLTTFTGISLQLPLYGQVNVSSAAGNTYSASINATDALVNAASVAVSADGTLVIGLSAGASIQNAQYTSPQTISIVVPAHSLSSIALTVTGGLVVDGSTINPATQLQTAGAAVASLVITGATAAGVATKSSGQAVTEIQGNLGAVSATSDGQGSTYFVGNVTSAQVDLSGQCNVFIDSSASPSPSITGSGSGQTAVIYSKGTCSVTGATCQQQSPIPLNPPALPPTSGSISLSASGSASSSSGLNAASSSSSVFSAGSASSSSSASTIG